MAKWLQSTDCIKFAVADRVARITLNRPEKRNALSGQLLRELSEALYEADDRSDVTTIVLEGAGKDFCAGYDLAGVYAGRREENDKRAAGDHDATLYRTMIGSIDDDAWTMERQAEKVLTFAHIHKPIIAKVHGNCLAGGTDIAFQCDMVIAAEDARIGFPAVRANGMPLSHNWYYHVGPQWAKRIMLSGDCVLGIDAARIGLVLDAVPAAELETEVMALARRIANIDIGLLTSNKRIINIAMELAGQKILQRLDAEMDARAHLANGPRRTRFKKDMAEAGLKEALKNRDAPFGDGNIRIRHAGGK
jgi:enoyl-CoA hydratase